MKALLIDDEPLARSIVAEYLQNHPQIEIVQECNDGFEGVKAIAQHKPDVIFLDIQMPKINGFEMLELIDQPPAVIFTTAFDEYAIKAFESHAVDYLLKTFTYKRFLQAAEKANEYYSYLKEKERTKEQYLFVRADYTLVKINIADILYIEGYDDYLKIHLLNQKPLITRMTLKTILEKLPSQQFIRIHRSYVVPLSRVDSLRNKVISLGDIKLPLGNSYEESFLKHFNK